jgi:hypothetical protein
VQSGLKALKLDGLTPSKPSRASQRFLDENFPNRRAFHDCALGDMDP